VHKIVSIGIVLAASALLPGAQALAAGRIISGKVVGADGNGIAEAIVFVQTPTSGAATPAMATMDQYDKTFVPGVLPIVVGTKVRFPNRDQIRHHVYSFSRAKKFELPLYKGEEAPPVMFDRPGMVKIGCNIHDWMSAIILVLPSSHYAVTDESGRYVLNGLDEGEYTVVAWHAQSRQKTEDIAQTVALSGGDREVDFSLSLSPARARPATRGARWEE
jgi:plastocyanin